ncbi:MAG: hypothetical protein R3Y22_03365 [Bacteroidales bacterium]
MKKILFLIVMAICSVTAASAQISVNESTLSATVGIGGSYGIPITLNYENALWGINSASCVTLGGTAGFGIGDDSSYFLVGVKSMYHYAIDAWDLSGGLTLGANVSGDVGLLWGVNVGASYYFNYNWAATAELGYGISVLRLGATYRF